MTSALPQQMDAETGDVAGFKSTIRPALAEAVRLMVMQGYTVTEAAEAVQMKRRSLVIALRKPHVIRHVTDVKRAWMENRTSRAWVNVAELADRAASEDVRLKANRVFLEAAGELGGRGSGDGDGPRTLVQIMIQAAQQLGQSPSQRLPGVFELPSPHGFADDTSNSQPVGRGEFDEEVG